MALGVGPTETGSIGAWTTTLCDATAADGRHQERSPFRGRLPAAAQLCCEAPVSDPATAHQQAIIALGNTVKRQALVMGFSNAFAVVGVVLVISGIAILLTGKPKGGAAAGGGH
jgi:DHA2 family multidrug resistance protein